jgi:hypothetical protein
MQIISQKSWILTHRTFSTPNSHHFNEPVIQICTIFICNIHQHETWLGTGQSQIMTLFQWNAGEDSSLPRHYAEYVSVWLLKFFKTVLPSSSQSSSPLLKATQPFTTSATTHPMTRLASQKTWLDTAVRTPNLTIQIQTKYRHVSFHAGLPSWTMSHKSNTKFPFKTV